MKSSTKGKKIKQQKTRKTRKRKYVKGGQQSQPLKQTECPDENVVCYWTNSKIQDYD
jgi:hypothetical protein